GLTGWGVGMQGGERPDWQLPSCRRAGIASVSFGCRRAEMRELTALAATFVALTIAVVPAAAEDPLTFRGKTITMIIGASAGGGSDATGRLIAPFLTKHP